MKDTKEREKNKKVTNSSKHEMIKTILFLFVFTAICVSITIFLILKSYGSNNLGDLKKIVDESVNPSDGKIVPDGLGVKSIDETYKENPIKITKINPEKTGKEEYDMEFSYVQISGLKNKDVENKINNRIKEVYNEKRKEIKKDKFDNIYLTINCSANFSNVISFHVDGMNIDPMGINFNLATGDDLVLSDIFTNTAAMQNILKVSAYNSVQSGFSGEDVVFTKAEIEKQNKEIEESKKNGEDPHIEIGDADFPEEYAFKFINAYKQNSNMNFYFTSRYVVIIWEGVTEKVTYGNHVEENKYCCVNVPMNKYYDQIAIYNRYKDHGDLYENENTSNGIFERTDRPVFTSEDNLLIQPSINYGGFSDIPLPISYLTVKKSDNLISIVRIMARESSITKMNVNELGNLFNKEISKYENLNDNKARCVVIQAMGDYDDDNELTYHVVEVTCDIKYKNEFYSKILENFQNGRYELLIDYKELENGDLNFEEQYIGDIKLDKKDENDDEGTILVFDEREKKWENLKDRRKEGDVSNTKKNKVIYIDPGHQAVANPEKEPVGPGASEMKAKSTPGEIGVVTGQKEYELNLMIAEKLRDVLQDKGYDVYLTRYSNDGDWSNQDRAELANNNAKTSAFIRIHTNTADSSDVSGVDTMCQTEQNEYNGQIAGESYALSKAVVDCVAKATGAKNNGVKRVDHTSGIDWCMVPTTIIEMGYLSNEEEDRLLATDEYQNKVVQGIVEGIEQYINN